MEEHFDPETCCDERERALIAAMRAYLRPEQAPERLLERLRATLDHDWTPLLAINKPSGLSHTGATLCKSGVH